MVSTLTFDRGRSQPSIQRPQAPRGADSFGGPGKGSGKSVGGGNSGKGGGEGNSGKGGGIRQQLDDDDPSTIVNRLDMRATLNQGTTELMHVDRLVVNHAHISVALIDQVDPRDLRMMLRRGRLVIQPSSDASIRIISLATF